MFQARLVPNLRSATLLVGDGHLVPIELGERDGELLVVALGFVLKHANRHGFAQEVRGVRAGAPVNSRVDSMSEADVAGQLVEFSADRDLARILTGVRFKRQT